MEINKNFKKIGGKISKIVETLQKLSNFPENLRSFEEAYQKYLETFYLESTYKITIFQSSRKPQ